MDSSFVVGFVVGIGTTVAIDTAIRWGWRWRRRARAKAKASGPRFAVGTKQKFKRPKEK